MKTKHREKSENKTQFKEFFRALKFTLISISAGIIQIGLFALLNEVFELNYWVSYLASLLASILWNFTINRKITFKAANNVTIAMLLVLAFYAVFTPVSTILGELAENSGINEYIVLATTMISNFILEFLFTRFVVYRNSCDTLESKKEENNSAQKKRKPFLFVMLVGLVRVFYRKRKLVNTASIPNTPSIIISNHAQMHGPISNQLFFPYPKSIWCIGQMTKMKEVPAYAYKDFWSLKPKYIRWFYKILSYSIAPLASFIMKSADTIAVYKDSRLICTFRDTIEGLKKGEHIIIFPECTDPYNEIINDFQDKFVDVAKMFYDRTGKSLSFVPCYNCAALKTISYGKPITYDPNLTIEDQRKKVCDYLKTEITRLAKELPRHKVVPYANIKKKLYPYSK